MHVYERFQAIVTSLRHGLRMLHLYLTCEKKKKKPLSFIFLFVFFYLFFYCFIFFVLLLFLVKGVEEALEDT